MSPQPQNSDAELIEACKHLISTLPVNNGLRIYNGFHIHEDELLKILLCQHHFKADPTDIILATYPKSGTTWLKANAFAILKRLPRSNLRDHPLLKVHTQECVPYVEFQFTTSEVPPDRTSPRAISTHMPHSLLPASIKDTAGGCKIVYVCRQPKDTFVSLWHFAKKAMKGAALEEAGRDLTIEKLADEFCTGTHRSLGCASVWDHQMEYWRASKENPERVLFLRYEDMLQSPKESVKKLAAFMGRAFTEEEEKEGVVDDIVKLCSIDFLRALEVNTDGMLSADDWYLKKSSFFRKGKAGGWKEDLTPEIIERMDKISKEKLEWCM